MPIAGDTNGARASQALSTAATTPRSRPTSHPCTGRIRFAVVAAGLVAACSVNVSKLRAPLTSASDAPVAPDLAPGPDAEGDSANKDAPRDATEVAEVADAAEVAKHDSANADLPRSDVLVPPEPQGRPEVGAPDREEDLPVIIGSGGAGGSGGIDGGEATGGMDTSAPGTGGMGGAGGSTGPGGRTGTGGAIATGGTGIDPDLVLWYKFDESSGTVAADSAAFGTGGHDGKVNGGGLSTAFTTDCQVGSHALTLAPSGLSGGGYVVVPSLQTLAPNEITVALWVKLTASGAAEDWERVFDFGNGSASSTGPYFYMTARASDVRNNPVRFGISRNGNTETSEQRLEATSALTPRVWHHIAVVLPPGTSYTGTLYIDGAVAATNDRMTLHLTDLATMTNYWLGRSQFSEDPYFNGSLDDFRVYKRALSQAEIAALYALR